MKSAQTFALSQDLKLQLRGMRSQLLLMNGEGAHIDISDKNNIAPLEGGGDLRRESRERGRSSLDFDVDGGRCVSRARLKMRHAFFAHLQCSLVFVGEEWSPREGSRGSLDCHRMTTGVNHFLFSSLRHELFGHKRFDFVTGTCKGAIGLCERKVFGW